MSQAYTRQFFSKCRMRNKLFKSIRSGTCNLATVDVVSKQINANACQVKLRLTEQEAANRLHKYPHSMSFYLCPECGYIHAGHESKWIEEARALVLKKEAEKRKQTTLNIPKWKTDPRIINV